MGNLYRKLRAVIHEAARQMKRKRRAPRKLARLAVRASALLLLATSAQAITNGAAPATNDLRFDAVGAFAASWRLGFDQGSHADDADHAWFCSATLVNEQQIVVERHCLAAYGPNATYMVRFRRREDGGLGTVSAGVSSFHHVRVASWTWVSTATNGGVAIGLLEDPVYHIVSIPLSSEGYVVNQPIIQAGWGRVGPGIGQGEATQLLTCANVAKAAPVGFPEWVAYPSPDITDYGYNACGVNTWDSGGPALASDACGNLRILASHLSAVVGSLVEEGAVDAAPPSVFYRCDVFQGSKGKPRKASK